LSENTSLFAFSGFQVHHLVMSKQTDDIYMCFSLFIEKKNKIYV